MMEVMTKITAFLFTLCIATSAAAENSSTIEYLVNCTAATDVRCGQVINAAKASIRLRGQLEALAAKGIVQRITIVDTQDIPKIRGVAFSAAFAGKTIYIENAMLDQLRKGENAIARNTTSLIPNNLVFVLSHLAYHAEHEQEMRQFEEQRRSEMEEKMRTASKKIPFDATQMLIDSQAKHLQEEAAAYLYAWNIMLDAAAEELQTNSLDIMQVNQLLRNFRYRMYILKAMSVQPIHIAIGADGHIELNQQNVAAMAEALRTSNVADFQ